MTTTSTKNDMMIIENLYKNMKLDLDLELVQDVLDRTVQILMTQLPLIRDVATQIMDTVFIPKVIGKQLIVLIALETGMMTVNQVSTLIQWLFVSTFSSRHRLIKQLQYQQQHVVATQDEWMDIAERIDTIQGNDVWRSDPQCALYERERIQARIDEYVHLMRRRDIFELMFLLRGSIGRNKFGLLHEGLYTRALAGSKVLTETYHNVVCAALDFVCDAPVENPNEEPIPTDARLAFFNETRHAYGRTALLLSGGAALGFYHVGLVKALMENGLLPRVIGGSSAGSIVCAMIGTRTDNECYQDLFEVKGTEAPGHSTRLSMNFFRPHPPKTSSVVVTTTTTGTTTNQENSITNHYQSTNGFLKVYYNTAGAFHDVKRTIQGFVPITLRRCSSFLYDLVTGNTRPQDVFKSDTAHFRQCVRDNVGDFTFQEAFDRTGRILNIVVTPNNSSDPPRLLNYLTAPHVMVWSAAVASSSLPGVFEANRLVVKEADGWERYESSGLGGTPAAVFSDGSMEQDLPMQQLSEMFNINHFIISQANPHAVLFASYTQKMSVWTNPITGFVHQILTFVRNQLRSWLLNLVQCVGARRITPLFETQRGIGTQFFTQEYEGRPSDISLVPWIGHRNLFSALLHIIYNPSEAEFREWIQAAERETWKHIPAIKSHIAEEVTLDRCVQRLRRRLLHESYEKMQMQHQVQQVQLVATEALQYGAHLQPQPILSNDNLQQAQQQQQHHHHHHPKRHHHHTHPHSSGTGNNVSVSNHDNKGGKPLEGRVPSFFTSHSLVNLSGLSIGDQLQLPPQMPPPSPGPATKPIVVHEYSMPIVNEYAMPIQPVLAPPPISNVVTNVDQVVSGLGWGGMGLRGNRSSGNLHRNLSDASGFFIDEQQQHPSHPTPTTTTTVIGTGADTVTNTTDSSTTPSSQQQQQQQQQAGESTVPVLSPQVSKQRIAATLTHGSSSGGTSSSSHMLPTLPRVDSASSNQSSSTTGTSMSTTSKMLDSYVKTSSMAKFYYRKAVHTPAEDYLQPSNGGGVGRMRSNSMYLLRRQRTSSESAMSVLEQQQQQEKDNNEQQHQDSGEKTTNNQDSSFSSSSTTQQQNQNQSHQLMSRHNRRLSRSVADFSHSSSNL